jgi:hypothetical protein
MIANEMCAIGIKYYGNFINVCKCMLDNSFDERLGYCYNNNGIYSDDKIKSQIDVFKNSAMFRGRAVEMWSQIRIGI